MTFTKLSDESKELIEQYKKQYGNENVGSYRALLMRGTASSDAINIINTRKQIQPVETKKQDTNANSRFIICDESADFRFKVESVPMASYRKFSSRWDGRTVANCKRRTQN